jgi:N-methylhydantoinase B
MSNTPVEVLEARAPVLIETFGYLPDSCGAGRYRGGLGLVRQYRLLAHEAIMQLRADRHRFPPYGLAGGRPARCGRNLLNPEGEARDLPAKVTMTIRAGDVIRHEQPGGGGHGDPALRDPAATLRDLADGKITLGHAREFYGRATAQ